jgi:hypothetical protein
MRCRFCAVSVPYPCESFSLRGGNDNGLLRLLILSFARDPLLFVLLTIDSQSGMTLLVKRISSNMCVLDLGHESEDFRYYQVL